MQVIKSKGVVNGFRAIELSDLLPEVIEFGEQWEPPGLQEKLHCHRHCELSYIVEGCVELNVSERNGLHTYKLSAGSFWSLPAQTGHCFRLGSGSRHHRQFLGLRLGLIRERHPELNFQQVFEKPVVFHDVYDLEPLFLKVIAEGTRYWQYQADALRWAVDGLLLEVLRQSLDSGSRASSAAIHPAVLRAMNLLRTRFREEWTLDRLADEVGFSRARVAGLFRQHVGTSVHQTLNKVRVEHARWLLKNSDLSIQAIAEDCGFATRQHLSRIFRNITSNSPQDYRHRLLAPRLSKKLVPIMNANRCHQMFADQQI
ncbi:MAG TPA: AraC family transcriptional regulator [Chthoniobacterales bacterium]|nr:AraC family transcriptional regulator [Chthoniobacterales bacterium]